MSHSSSGSTSVRLPCWMRTSPSIASPCTVSRATVRLTLKRFTIASVDGNCLAGREAAGDDLGGEHVVSWCESRRGSFSSRATAVKS